MKLAEAAAVVAQVWWTYLDHLRSILFDLPNHSVVILCLYLGILVLFYVIARFQKLCGHCLAFNQVPVCDFKVDSSMSETFFGSPRGARMMNCHETTELLNLQLRICGVWFH